MRYIMKEKVFALGDDFTIRDESGTEQYYVDGKVFTIGDKLSMKDRQGTEVAFIRQKLLRFSPTYEVSRRGEVVAVVQKKLFTLLHCRFSVDVPGPDDLEAKGDFLDHEYAFKLQGRTVAEVSKKWIALVDSYVIDIAPGQDHELLLACAVVIDLVCHEDKH